jgi:hypothetical protein
MKIIRESVPVTATLPSELASWQVPKQVLQRRMITHRVRPVLQGLIKWSASPASLATWEDLEALQQCFPDAPAWGQVGSHEEGNVRASDGSFTGTAKALE